jgi:16S rRNA processing protein RimM
MARHAPGGAVTKDLVLMGVITGAHGIKGAVKLRSFTANPRDIASYGPLQSRNGEAFEILRLKPAKDDFICTLKTVTDRNRSEALKGTELFVARERLPKPGDDEIYHHDIIGLPVHAMDGSHVGEVRGIENFGAGDLLDVAMPGRADTLLIPFAPPFAQVKDNAVVIDLPDGYLDPE